MDGQLYVVHDHGREIDFFGVLLGSSSSYARGKTRWFEVAIYKSQGGKYIVSGVGRTTVVHKASCKHVTSRNVQDQLPLPTYMSACDACHPSLADDFLVPELDRQWAQVSDEADAVIERLRLRDADGVFYIPHTSINALNEAATVDDALAQALLAPQHIE